MEHFKEYELALAEAGPRLRRKILHYASEDRKISVEELNKLVQYSERMSQAEGLELERQRLEELQSVLAAGYVLGLGVAFFRGLVAEEKKP